MLALARPAVPGPGAGVPADGRGRRRPGLAGRHRASPTPRRIVAGPAGCRRRGICVVVAGAAAGRDPVRDRLYALLGVAAWVAVLKSGVDPVVVGLVMGLLTFAYPAARSDLERASDLFRSFREQPTPELARSARAGLASALSPERAAAAAVPPVDQLRRSCRCSRWPTPGSCSAALPRPRVHLAGHAGHPDRLRRRQAASASRARPGC